MTTKIPLTQGQYALIDDEDTQLVNQWKWHARWHPSVNSFYATRTPWDKSKKKYTPIQMHREIMQCPKGFEVDHINHNTLDNRKRNLRIVTHRKNMWNRRGAQRNNKSSGILNVYWHVHRKYWYVAVVARGKQVYLGSYNYLNAAKRVAIEARKELFRM